MDRLPDHASPEFLEFQSALAGRYSLESELGRGGMGIVFLAREVALDRMVALKLLPPKMAEKPGLKERFLAEARTAARLSHPNIVPIYAVDEVEGFVFFAMAYIKGGTLADRVRRRGPLPNGEAIRVIKEVAWALSHAHVQGIVHRDVKPENILLEADSGRAMVTDFGIAVLAEGGPETSATGVIGTAEFMSPEQAAGGEVDARSDLYSLAAVGFYALSGTVPFKAPSPQAIMARKLQEPAPLLTSAAPATPAPVANALDRCLRRDPEDRLSGCQDLADALMPELEAGRELPVPLRVFVKETREFERTVAWSGLVLVGFGPGLVVSAATGGLLGALGLGGFLAGLTGFCGVRLARIARRLLRSGFTLQDGVTALERDVERREEEYRFQMGEKSTWLDTGLKAGMIGGFGTVATALLADALGILSLSAELPGWAMVTGLVSALWWEVRKRNRQDIMGKRWLRFWKDRLGKWSFRLGGLGLKRVAPAVSGLHRPTEVVIGLAADRLFAELPGETRKAFKGLPETVRDLEEDAQALRRQIREMEAVLAEIGDDDPAAPHAEERERVRIRVEATRDQARTKLRDAVAALEKIRLGLLRMQAGSGQVENLTLELEAARDLSRDMEHLLEGHQEVERILAEERSAGDSTRRSGGSEPN